MSAWPTLREWFQFGGTLALELAVIFAVAKLVSLRLRSASWRRALWQMSLLAMLLVVTGESNGVRGWLRRPEKKSSPLVEKKVVVTLQDVEPDLELFRARMMTEARPLTATTPKPAPRPSRWQQHAAWPVMIWTAMAGFIFFRMLIAQILAGLMRWSASRSKVGPLALRAVIGTRLAARVFPPSPLTDDIGLPHRVRRIAQTLGIRRPVVLLINGRAAAPFTFGAWRPVIVLPANFSETFTPEQQDAALAHELAHVAGFDSAWRCFSQLTCAVLWWHPLVWLAKRELDHASELVADESSLLLADGPDRLAECLVACAKELRRPALTTWLGMDGGGFRSALGKRVTRLLQLSPQTRLSRPVPWYLRIIAPMVCVALLWLGMAAVLKSDEPRDSAWRSSILGSAFAATAQSAEVKRIVPAATTTNSATASNLSDIPRSGGLFSNQEPNRAGLRLQMSAKRQQIYDKLRSIHLSEWGPLDNLPLSEVIRGLSAETRRIDLEHQGVNFFLSSPRPASQPTRLGASGLPIAPTNEPNNLNATTVRLGTKLYNLNAEEVLNILMKIADRKIQYSVEDHGVVISPAGNEPTPLHTRFFRMNSKDNQRALQSMPRELTNTSAMAPDNVGVGRRADFEATNGIRFLNEITPAEVVTPEIRSLLKSFGVELTEPGKAVFYNDKLGLLMIRATLEDLEVIEKALQAFGIMPRAGSPPLSASELTNRVSGDRTAADEPRIITQEMQVEAARLVQRGKLFYETGQMKAARTNLQAALLLNPTHQDALYYLDWVNAHEQAVRAKTKDLKTEPEDTWKNQVQDDSATNLQTRFFHVDPNTLEQGLKSISTQGGGGGRNGGRKPVFNPNDTNSVIERVQQLFQAAGVDLSAPGRTLLYQELVGMVMVRATPAELDTIGKAVQLLNMTPPQLTIRVKILEVEKKSGQGLGFDWFLGTLVTNQFSPMTLNAASPVARSGMNPPGINDAIPSELLTSGLRTRGPSPTNATITGILTDEQFRNVIKALESRGGTDLLSAPEVTTMSGRQAQIKVVDIQYIVTDLDLDSVNKPTKPTKQGPNVTGGETDTSDVILPIAQPFELGPVVDVIPYVEADGQTIQLTVIPSVKEFLGYDDPGPFTASVSNRVSKEVLTSPVPLPKFRLRQVVTSARVWDGQTLMLSAGTVRSQQKVRDESKVNGVVKRTVTTNYTEKTLFFFITPRLIDPAGNPLHADDEFPLLQKTVPGQQPQAPR